MLTHSTLHTKEYIQYVNDTLEVAESKEDAVRIIADIRKQLITGNVK